MKVVNLKRNHGKEEKEKVQNEQLKILNAELHDVHLHRQQLGLRHCLRNIWEIF